MNSTKDDKPLEDGLKITNEKDEDSEKDVDCRKSPPFVSKPGKKNGSPEFSIDSLIHRKTKDVAEGKQRLYFYSLNSHRHCNIRAILSVFFIF